MTAPLLKDCLHILCEELIFYWFESSFSNILFLAFQFEEALRRNAQAEYEKLVLQQEKEEEELRTAAESESQELQQLQVNFRTFHV